MPDEIDIDATPQNIAVNIQAQEIAAQIRDYSINVEISGALVPGGVRSNISTFTAAGQIISALRGIRINAAGKAVYASSANLADANTVLGVSITAASLGSTVILVTSGEIENAEWNWTPSAPIYLGVDGVLTQVPPISEFVQCIGNATTAKKMKVNIQTAIIL
jgi:hypothetical protein